MVTIIKNWPKKLIEIQSLSSYIKIDEEIQDYFSSKNKEMSSNYIDFFIGNNSSEDWRKRENMLELAEENDHFLLFCFLIGYFELVSYNLKSSQKNKDLFSIWYYKELYNLVSNRDLLDKDSSFLDIYLEEYSKMLL